MSRTDRFSVSFRLISIAFIAAPLAGTGCWDEVTHDCDCGDNADASTGNTGWSLPEGWEGLGEACETDEDCQGYPGERRCVQDILSLINVPGGYCTSCCDAEEIDGCADGIDCVGANGVYLVCVAHCGSDEDCRQEEGYVCRPIYYIPEVFPGNYCLPTPDLVEPDTDNTEELECPWPWL